MKFVPLSSLNQLAFWLSFKGRTTRYLPEHNINKHVKCDRNRNEQCFDENTSVVVKQNSY